MPLSAKMGQTLINFRAKVSKLVQTRLYAIVRQHMQKHMQEADAQRSFSICGIKKRGLRSSGYSASQQGRDVEWISRSQIHERKCNIFS